MRLIILAFFILSSCGRIEFGDMESEIGDKLSIKQVDRRLQNDVDRFFEILTEEGVMPLVRVKSIGYKRLEEPALGRCNIDTSGIGSRKNNIILNEVRRVHINETLIGNSGLQRLTVFHELTHCSLNVIDSKVPGHDNQGHSEEFGLMASHLPTHIWLYNEDTEMWYREDILYTEEEADEMLIAYIRRYKR